MTETCNLWFLGRALGHFIFSLIGLKRTLFTNIFQELYKPHLGLVRCRDFLKRVFGSRIPLGC